MLNEQWKPLAVAIALIASCTTPGWPCGYHGFLGDGFSALHARSITVAVAIRAAADENLLDSEIVTPKVIDLLALNKANLRLYRLRSALQSGPHSTQTPFSVLLVESGMWSRYLPDGSELKLAVHTSGPLPGDEVMVTGNAVLAAIEKGRISVQDAIRRGLIVIDGQSSLAHALATAL